MTKLKQITTMTVIGLIAALLVLPTETADAQGQLKIIVNPDLPLGQISQTELARIYLGKKTLWDGSNARISPSLLNEKSPVTKEFLEDNVKKTVRQYRAYWKRRLFSGAGTAPKAFSSSKQVADFVAANPGAIGVIDAGFNDDRVKVIQLEN